MNTAQSTEVKNCGHQQAPWLQQDTEGSAGLELRPLAADPIVAASERLRAAIEQLERIERLELEILREALRVTQQASAALGQFGAVEAER